MIIDNILYISFAFVAFTLGGRLGIWTQQKEIIRLQSNLALLHDEAEMLRKMNDTLRVHNFDMKNVNGGSMGTDYFEDADKRHNS